MPRYTPEQLKVEYLKKLERETETLPQFLARMTVVYEGRQERLATADARRAASSKASVAKRKALDPEAFNRARREAVARYAAAHPDRVREKVRVKELKRLAKKAALPPVVKAVAVSKVKHKPAIKAQVDALALAAAVPNSVFSLASVASAGGVAKRREGGAAPLSADDYKATTWRAPWAAPYALSKRGRSP